ncbi:histidine kinase [uncultured Mobiluncus sp.]|uniref:histidine kinase n=1 Tax=uncultured Mobiluncus sp. TaxID=293425 RepID=UPI00262A6236|nr:histidine kinase [uncultured Mobiluncus sp.]
MSVQDIVWLIAVICAVIIFVTTTAWIIVRSIRLYRTVRDIELPAADTAESVREPARKPAPTGDAATLSAARVARAEVKQARKANKQRRLNAAHDRWASYDLVAPRQ